MGGDLVAGREFQSAIGTLVERTTRLLMIVPLKAKKSDDVVNAFAKRMNRLPELYKCSLTYDRGVEIAKHQLFTKLTSMKVYLADPGCPWQRGTNENTNGLIRDFFPKKTDFSKVKSEA